MVMNDPADKILPFIWRAAFSIPHLQLSRRYKQTYSLLFATESQQNAHQPAWDLSIHVTEAQLSCQHDSATELQLDLTGSDLAPNCDGFAAT
jgi:hypothetical protein